VLCARFVRHARRHALVLETSFVYFIFFVCLYFVSLILASRA
jgi:hypothetical protein